MTDYDELVRAASRAHYEEIDLLHMVIWIIRNYDAVIDHGPPETNRDGWFADWERFIDELTEAKQLAEAYADAHTETVQEIPLETVLKVLRQAVAG